MNALLRPMRSPTLLPIRMNAADTSASSAMADCTPLTVVSRSLTTAEIDTFITEVSTTRTNMAAASSNDSRCAFFDASRALAVVGSVIAGHLSMRSYGEDDRDSSTRDHFAEWAQSSRRGAGAAFPVEHAAGACARQGKLSGNAQQGSGAFRRFSSGPKIRASRRVVSNDDLLRGTRARTGHPPAPGRFGAFGSKRKGSGLAGARFGALGSKRKGSGLAAARFGA